MRRCWMRPMRSEPSAARPSPSSTPSPKPSSSTCSATRRESHGGAWRRLEICQSNERLDRRATSRSRRTGTGDCRRCVPRCVNRSVREHRSSRRDLDPRSCDLAGLPETAVDIVLATRLVGRVAVARTWPDDSLYGRRSCSPFLRLGRATLAEFLVGFLSTRSSEAMLASDSCKASAHAEPQRRKSAIAIAVPAARARSTSSLQLSRRLTASGRDRSEHRRVLDDLFASLQQRAFRGEL